MNNKFKIGENVKIDHIRGFGDFDGKIAIITEIKPYGVTYDYAIKIDDNDSQHVSEIFVDEHELIEI